jgi:hypothetical protein
VIRTVALGVVCLAAPEIVMPVVAGNKADRLPIIIHQDALANAEKVDVVYVPFTEQDQITPPPSAPQEVHHITILFLVIGTIRMILRPRRQSKKLAAQSRQRSALLTTP